jgi:hypothetical protein
MGNCGARKNIKGSSFGKLPDALKGTPKVVILKKVCIIPLVLSKENRDTKMFRTDEVVIADEKVDYKFNVWRKTGSFPERATPDST